MCETNYPSDPTNEQRQISQPLLPQSLKRGDRRSIVELSSTRSCISFGPAASGGNCRSILRSERWSRRCSGDGAKPDFGNACTTRYAKGLHDALGKKRTPTVAILDSQSVRTAERGEIRGVDVAKENHRPQATSGGRLSGTGLDGHRAWRRLARSRWSLRGAHAIARAMPKVEVYLCSQWLRSQPPARLVQSDVRLGAANRSASASYPRPRRATQGLACRGHLRLAGSIPSQQQGLRTQPGSQRSDHLHHSDQPDGTPPGSETWYSKARSELVSYARVC